MTSSRASKSFWASIALCVALPTFCRGDEPPFASLLVRDNGPLTSVIGVVLTSSDSEVEVLDLESLQKRTFSRGAIQKMTSGLSEQQVASQVGLAPLVAWRIAQVLP